MPPERIAVVGAGSWGTALAVHLSRIGHQVQLWARDESFAARLAADRINVTYLPQVPLPDALYVTASLPRALTDCGVIVLAVPSHGLRSVLRQTPAIAADTLVVSATKGLEEGTLSRMSEVIASELPQVAGVAVLSGPSFAAELARELPTAIVVASERTDAIARVQQNFRSPSLRLYGSVDVTGVEFGGALKNVIAIAAGAVEGLGLGQNALAALITRGLAELTRLSVGYGAQRETLAGLAGLGDLVLTCTGSLSRNRQVGLELARGRTLPDILESTKMVAEGVRTTGAALALGAARGIELPIAAQMAKVFAGECDPNTAVCELMGRRQRLE